MLGRAGRTTRRTKLRKLLKRITAAKPVEEIDQWTTAAVPRRVA